MHLETRKIQLINWITHLQDANIVSKLEKLYNQEPDWWDTLSLEDKKAIEEGLSQLDKGEHYTQEQVRSEIKKKFNF
ncbi:MAG: hypothetical protein KAT68_01380 [Bacteroidales bacterium]|nr:hypothetical protein [Bacteroidales bacterium]